MLTLELLLEGYELASGLKMKFEKSSVILSADNAQRHTEIVDTPELCRTVFPITYLGIPLRPGRLHAEDWEAVIDKRRENFQGGRQHPCLEEVD